MSSPHAQMLPGSGYFGLLTLGLLPSMLLFSSSADDYSPGIELWFPPEPFLFGANDSLIANVAN